MKTTSIELSKQLKEAGFPQYESQFYWTKIDDETHWYVVYYENGISKGVIETGLAFAAPTAEEILEKLPYKFSIQYPNSPYIKNFWLTCERIGLWEVGYWGKVEGYPKIKEVIESKSLGEAAGKMWLYLKENNLLKNA